MYLSRNEEGSVMSKRLTAFLYGHHRAILEGAATHGGEELQSIRLEWDMVEWLERHQDGALFPCSSADIMMMEGDEGSSDQGEEMQDDGRLINTIPILYYEVCKAVQDILLSLKLVEQSSSPDNGRADGKEADGGGGGDASSSLITTFHGLDVILRLTWAPFWRTRDLFLAKQQCSSTMDGGASSSPVTLAGCIHAIHVPEEAISYQRYQCPSPTCRDPSSLHVRHMYHHHPPGSNCAPPLILSKQTSTHAQLPVLHSRVAQIAQVDLYCASCDSRMAENLLARRTFPTQRILVRESAHHLTTNGDLYLGQIDVMLDHEHVGAVQVGQHVRIIGYQVTRDLKYSGMTTSSMWMMERCLSIQIAPASVSLPSIPESLSLLRSLPPYELSQHLVDRFCVNVCPPSQFRKLKLSLLLSLACLPFQDPGKDSHESCLIHVFIQSDSSCALLSRLIQKASMYANRRSVLYHHRPPEKQRLPLLDSITPITMARNGVFLAFTSPKASRLLDQLHHDAIHAPESAVTVWTVHQQQHACKRNGAFLILPPTSSAYDLRINALFCVDEDADECIAAHLLAQSTSTCVSTDLGIHDWLSMAQSLPPVQITPEAQEILILYFTCLRRLCGKLVTGVDGMWVTVESLIRVTKAHAKLCLRSEGELDDALVAIWLVEESLCLSTGKSLLGFTSLPGDNDNMKLRYKNIIDSKSEPLHVPDDDHAVLSPMDEDMIQPEYLHEFVAFYHHLMQMLSTIDTPHK